MRSISLIVAISLLFSTMNVKKVKAEGNIEADTKTNIEISFTNSRFMEIAGEGVIENANSEKTVVAEVDTKTENIVARWPRKPPSEIWRATLNI